MPPRGGVREPLELVEREHERRAVVLDGAQQQGRALERAETGRGGGQRAGRVQPGALQGEREIGVESGRPVAVVEEQPRGRDPAPGKFAAAGRQQGRLAESAGRLQQGHAPVGGQAARGELGTVQIARHRIGHGNRVREQPGRGRRRRAGRGGVRPALSSGQRPAPECGPGRRREPSDPDRVRKSMEKQVLQKDLKQSRPSPGGRLVLGITEFIGSQRVAPVSGLQPRCHGYR